jgi:hypothetical protein
VIDAQRDSTGKFILKWPAAYTNFVLQTSSILPATNWSNVSNPPMVESDMCVVTNPSTSGNQFFRLARQETKSRR